MLYLLYLCQIVYGKYGGIVRKNMSVKCIMLYFEILVKFDRIKVI